MVNGAGPLLGFVLALAITPANAQAGATPATPHPFTASELHEPPAQSPTRGRPESIESGLSRHSNIQHPLRYKELSPSWLKNFWLRLKLEGVGAN
jgi:hypothetical protein